VEIKGITGRCKTLATLVTAICDREEQAHNRASTPEKDTVARESPSRNGSELPGAKKGNKLSPLRNLAKTRSWNKLPWGRKSTRPEKGVRSASLPPSPKPKDAAARVHGQVSIATKSTRPEKGERLASIPPSPKLDGAARVYGQVSIATQVENKSNNSADDSVDVKTVKVNQNDTRAAPQPNFIKLRRQHSWNGTETRKLRSLVAQQPSDDLQSPVPQLPRTRSLNRVPQSPHPKPQTNQIKKKSSGSLKPPLIPKPVVVTQTDKFVSNHNAVQVKCEVRPYEGKGQDVTSASVMGHQRKEVVAKCIGSTKPPLIPKTLQATSTDESISDNVPIEVERKVKTFEGEDQDKYAVTFMENKMKEVATKFIGSTDSPLILKSSRAPRTDDYYSNHVAIEVENKVNTSEGKDQDHNVVTVVENDTVDEIILQPRVCEPSANEADPEDLGRRTKLPFLIDIVEKKKALDAKLERESQEKKEDLQKAREAEKAEKMGKEKNKSLVSGMVKKFEESHMVKHVEAWVPVKEQQPSIHNIIEKDVREIPTDLVLVAVSEKFEDVASSVGAPELRLVSQDSSDSSAPSSWISSESSDELAMLGMNSFDSWSESFSSYEAHQQMYELSNVWSMSSYRRKPDARRLENNNPPEDIIKIDVAKLHRNALKKIQDKTRDARNSSTKAASHVVELQQRRAALTQKSLGSHSFQDGEAVDTARKLEQLPRQELSDKIFDCISSIFDFLTCGVTNTVAVNPVRRKPAEKIELIFC